MPRPDLDGIRLRLRNATSSNGGQVIDFHFNAAADITQLLAYVEDLETELGQLRQVPELRRGSR